MGYSSEWLVNGRVIVINEGLIEVVNDWLMMDDYRLAIINWQQLTMLKLQQLTMIRNDQVVVKWSRHCHGWLSSLVNYCQPSLSTIMIFQPLSKIVNQSCQFFTTIVDEPSIINDSLTVIVITNKSLDHHYWPWIHSLTSINRKWSIIDSPLVPWIIIDQHS